MWLLPVARRGVPEEPAVDLVVQTAPSHRVERHLDEVRHRRVFGLAIQVERELERGGQRKLRLGAEAAVPGIERVEDVCGNIQLAAQARRTAIGLGASELILAASTPRAAT